MSNDAFASRLYLPQVITGEYKAAKNVALVREAKKALAAARAARVRVDFTHVKGHSGDRFNDVADELAKQGARGRRCTVGRWAPQPVLVDLT